MSENILSKQNISPQFSKWWILLIAMAGVAWAFAVYGISTIAGALLSGLLSNYCDKANC